MGVSKTIGPHAGEGNKRWDRGLWQESSVSVDKSCVQVRPTDGWQGESVLDTRTFVVEQVSKSDEKGGALRVGSCAKIPILNGRVHEIDSEPMQECK
jgi:hypothetical protein